MALYGARRSGKSALCSALLQLGVPYKKSFLGFLDGRRVAQMRNGFVSNAYAWIKWMNLLCLFPMP